SVRFSTSIAPLRGDRARFFARPSSLSWGPRLVFRRALLPVGGSAPGFSPPALSGRGVRARFSPPFSPIERIRAAFSRAAPPHRDVAASNLATHPPRRDVAASNLATHPPRPALAAGLALRQNAASPGGSGPPCPG